jgi:GT2 family glycosyltransferase
MKEQAGEPLISVCIANYNGGPFIRSCIESVRRQTGAQSLEIIVHDDASTDNSLEVLQQISDIRLLVADRNVGFCIANNRMAAVARGRFLLLLNNDAELFPDSLATLLAESARAGDRAIIGLPQYDHHSRRLVDRGVLLDLFANPIPLTGKSCPEPAMVIGACMWIPKPCWEDLGGFPEWFEMNAEDMYLCCLARWRGYPVRVAQASGYLHRMGATFGAGESRGGPVASTIRRRFLSERNKSFVLCLLYPAPLLVLILPMHLLLLLIEGAAVALCNRRPSLVWDIYLRSQLQVVGASVTLWQRRRALLRNAAIDSRTFLRPVRCAPRKLQLLLRFGMPSIHD